jgi:hypothetical protein
MLMLALAFAASTVGASTDPRVRIVMELYKDYAWEAVIDEPNVGIGIQEESLETLEKYFTPEFAALLAADRQCAISSGELCVITTRILWKSQDPGASLLRVRRIENTSDVEVSFVYPGSNKKLILIYEVAVLPSGMGRISDIKIERESLRSAMEGYNY